MNFDGGETKILNPQKKISEETTLDVITQYRDILRQAMSGDIPSADNTKLTENQRKINQANALSKIIGFQMEMIIYARPVLKTNCYNFWKKRYPPEKREEFPFEKYESDYSKLMSINDFLKMCLQEIEKAKRSPKKDDDFIKEILNRSGESEFLLTDNFWEMIDDLADSFEQIYEKMIKHKIVSAGVEENEEYTQKELEKTFINDLAEIEEVEGGD